MQNVGTTAPAQVIRLADIEAAVAAFAPPPPSEVRMHPDDMRELLQRFGTTQRAPAGTVVMTIVADTEAPRLPRKA